MSELITRRTFLKATGAAALVVAAGSMLVGCGDGYDAPLNPPTLPLSDHYQADNFSDRHEFLPAALLNQILNHPESRGHGYLYAALWFSGCQQSFLSAKTDFTFALIMSLQDQPPFLDQFVNFY